MSFNEAPPQPNSFEYKNTVREIQDLNWEKLETPELQQLMHVSYVAAIEFAESLRIAQKLYPDNENLKKMISGELETQNLQFDEYSERADHSAFLAYFLNKSGIPRGQAVSEAGEKYLASCRSLDDETRAMSVFSREEELAGIFERILNAKDWDAPGLPAFKYFLSKHIALDTDHGGHHDLTKSFELNDRIKPFYEARRDLYRCIPKLFRKG